MRGLAVRCAINHCQKDLGIIFWEFSLFAIKKSRHHSLKRNEVLAKVTKNNRFRLFSIELLIAQKK